MRRFPNPSLGGGGGCVVWRDPASRIIRTIRRPIRPLRTEYNNRGEQSKLPQLTEPSSIPNPPPNATLGIGIGIGIGIEIVTEIGNGNGFVTIIRTFTTR
jgi:hypothetical protein